MSSTVFPTPEAPRRFLSDEELATYAEDGVLCARGLLGPDTISRMTDALEAVIATESVLGAQLKKGADDGFHGDIFVWKLHDAFRDMALFSSLPALANQILDSKTLNFFYEQFFVKRAGSPVTTPWHQDIPFWPVAGEQLVSFWITLDPVSRASSGLEFVRGSHRWKERYKAVTPNYDPYMMDTDLPISPNFAAERESHDVVGWDMEPGDVLIFGPTICHGSEGNTSNERDRRALAFRYSGDDVTFAPRHATMPLLWEHGLEAGDRLGGSLFPQVWPEVLEDEIAARWAAPEPPSPVAVGQFLRNLQDAGFGPGGDKASIFNAAGAKE